MKLLLVICSILSIFYFSVFYASASSTSLDKFKVIELKKVSLIDDKLNSFIDDRYKNKFCSYSQLWQLNDGYKLSQTFGILETHVFFKLAIIKQINTPNNKSPQLHKWYLKKIFNTEISNRKFWYDLDNKTTKLSKGSFALMSDQFMLFLRFLLDHFPDLADYNVIVGTEAIFSNKAVENNYYGMKGPFKVDINFNNGSKHDILELIPCINKSIKYFVKFYSDLTGKELFLPDIEELLRTSSEFHSRYKKVFKINHYSYQEESNKFILNRKGSFKNKKVRRKK